MDINFTGLLVLKFFSDSCVPCKRLIPIMEKMAKEFEAVKIYSISIDDDYKLAKQFNIMSVPTLIFMDGEKEVLRIEGLANTETIRKAFKNITK